MSTRKGIMCQLTNRGGLATIFYAATSDNATTMYIKPSVTCLNIYVYIKNVVSTPLSGNATGDNFCVHKTVPDYRVVRMCPALKTSIGEFGFFKV